MKNRSKVIFIFVSLAVLLVVGLFINNSKSKELLGTYIDGQYSDIMPSKYSGYVVEKIVCDNNTVGEWDYDNWGITLTNLSKKSKCNVYFIKNAILNNIKASLDTTGKCPTVNSDGTVNVTGAESENSLLCSAPDNYGTSYYYRGNVQNNYVRFANFYWRIVRINGDNSIRLIYDGTSAHENGEESEDRIIGYSAFNEKFDDNAYVGYMYGTPDSSTYEETHANINDSTIKKYIDNWYENNLKDTKYEEYIADNLFCNDKRLSSSDTGLGIKKNRTIYVWLRAPWDKDGDKNYLDLRCYQKIDSYSRDVINGNGTLKYPIALINYDEMVLSGGFNEENSKYYMFSGNEIWSMTLNYFNGNAARLRSVFSNGNLNNNTSVDNIYGVKTVINLKPNSLKSGDGTINNPYNVE